jgi:uncharacterized protein
MKYYSGITVKLFCSVVVFSISTAISAPKNILHYTKTGYFSYIGGNMGCKNALDTLAARYHFTVKHSNDRDELLNLKNYDIVIYDNNTDAGGASNTIGAPEQALMDYMNNGGKYLGIHGAADHRNMWDWYDSALYGGVKMDYHNSGNFLVFADTSANTKKDFALNKMWTYAKDSLKIATDSIPFNSQYFLFNSDVRGQPNVTVIQESILLSTQSNLKDTVRHSFTWTKSMPNGGRMMYTSLGYEPFDWMENNFWFTKAMWAYMKYLVGDFSNAVSLRQPEIFARGSALEIRTSENHDFKIRDITGKVVATGKGSSLSNIKLRKGVYFVTLYTSGSTVSKTIFMH